MDEVNVVVNIPHRSNFLIPVLNVKIASIFLIPTRCGLNFQSQVLAYVPTIICIGPLKTTDTK
jgi:hypothetical protein